MAEAVSALEKNCMNMDMTASWDAAAGKSRQRVSCPTAFVQTDRRPDPCGIDVCGERRKLSGSGLLKVGGEESADLLINGYVEGENIYCFYGDDRQGAYDVTSALIRRGKQRILFLADSHTFSAQQNCSDMNRLSPRRDPRYSEI